MFQHGEGSVGTLTRPPVVPKAPKVPVKSSTLSAESERYQQQHQQQQQQHQHQHHLQTLDSAGLHAGMGMGMGVGTLKKRNTDSQGLQAQRMDEFRV